MLRSSTTPMTARDVQTAFDSLKAPRLSMLQTIETHKLRDHPRKIGVGDKDCQIIKDVNSVMNKQGSRDLYHYPVMSVVMNKTITWAIQGRNDLESIPSDWLQ